MGDMLSQDEINALLGGINPSDVALDEEAEVNGYTDDTLTDEHKDILGEIGNISMGTSATTLFALLGQKVIINTPKVSTITWQEMTESYDRPCVGIRVDYKEGLEGSNILILKEHDVKIISNLMMGGNGQVEDEVELSEIDLSAIGEAMNQMVGSSSTSISSMINRKIDIDTPHAFLLDFEEVGTFFNEVGFSPDEIIVCVRFKMQIGTLIDSEIMQILPKEFAIEMVETLKKEMMSTASPQDEEKQLFDDITAQEGNNIPPTPSQAQYGAPPQQPYGMPPQQQYGMPPQQPYGVPPQQQYNVPPQQPYGSAVPPYNQYTQNQMNQDYNVKPAQFQNFDVSAVMQQKENIDIIMDVPLEVTVELGRTNKKIREILEFSPGTIIELDKLAGEPIDILVNGKFVAKGEVVVIDENFGIRITDIISPEKRI